MLTWWEWVARAGGELFEKLVQVGVFSERTVAHHMKQILEALAACHASNIVHRDVRCGLEGGRHTETTTPSAVVALVAAGVRNLCNKEGCAQLLAAAADPLARTHTPLRSHFCS